MATEYTYTVTTPHGDVNLTTGNHHSAYDDIEEFLAAHQSTVTTALGLTSISINVLGVYLSHGRKGPKLR